MFGRHEASDVAAAIEQLLGEPAMDAVRLRRLVERMATLIAA
jgi:hypothetical protein